MGALDAFTASQDDDKAEVMVRGTHEVTLRIYEPYRVHKWWKPDVQAGRRLLARFRVRPSLPAVPAPEVFACTVDDRCSAVEGPLRYPDEHKGYTKPSHRAYR